MPESKRHSYITYDSKGFTPIDGRLPYWGAGNPNLSWGFEGASGLNGNRYLHYPKANFYVNEDGTVRAFGYESIPIVNRRGVNYIEIMVPGEKSTSTWNTGNYGMYTVNNYYRIPVGETTQYVKPVVPPPVLEEPIIPVVQEQPDKPIWYTTFVYDEETGKLLGKRSWIKGQAGKGYWTLDGIDLNIGLKDPYYKDILRVTDDQFFNWFNEYTNPQTGAWDVKSGNIKSPGKVYLSLRRQPDTQDPGELYLRNKDYFWKNVTPNGLSSELNNLVLQAEDVKKIGWQKVKKSGGKINYINYFNK